MKILLTGASGYIGKRLLPVLLDAGHQVVCCVRDRRRFSEEGIFRHQNVSIMEVDFLKELPPADMIRDIDAAYYLLHSMAGDISEFEKLEELSARNFISLVKGTRVKQVIYLGGIANETKLSRHLSSRKRVEEILHGSGIPVTTIRAGIIVGSGSASFEIIRDLVEKLPVMIAPKWLNTRIQPIAIRDIIAYLRGVLLREETYNRKYDVGGPEVLTYREMLLQFAEVRNLRRVVITVPVMTPRLSSYWLYFVTSTSYKLAVNLVNSMKVEVVAENNELEKLLGISPIPYKEAVRRAFRRYDQNNVLSSWKDALASSYPGELFDRINVPAEGCFIDRREKLIPAEREEVAANIWSVGGERGWYYANWLWKLRGVVDKMAGGVGLRRGRTSINIIHPGDAIDFWRVLAADRLTGNLLLYAEMKLPGEAWLEFRIIEKDGKSFLQQTATFRPRGLLGRLYWYSLLPVHYFLFDRMAGKIVTYRQHP